MRTLTVGTLEALQQQTLNHFSTQVSVRMKLLFTNRGSPRHALECLREERTAMRVGQGQTAAGARADQASRCGICHVIM